MLRLLIISYHFPPDSEIGAVRPAKFAKYLPEFGWEPIVLTVKEQYYERHDRAKTDAALKDLRIYRCSPIPGPLHLYSKLRSSRNGKTVASHSSIKTIGKTIQPGKSSFLKRFASSLLRLPDDYQGWALNVAGAGYRIVKKHGVDAFMTSGPPMSTHLGGFLLKKITGIRWIADFRDPWVGTRRWKDQSLRSVLCDGLEERFEMHVLEAADVVVSTAPGLTRYFTSRLPSSGARKCITITNGFDEPDFHGLEGLYASKKPGITLRHAGSLYLGRDPEPFFRALRNLLDRRAIPSDSFAVEFIGDAFYNNRPLFELLKEYNLESIVHLAPRMAFRACLERLASADALLLFAQGFAEQIPAKVFEYLRLNRPIFALADTGDVRDMLRRFPNCFIADPGRIDVIEDSLLALITAIKTDGLRNQSVGEISQYDRKRLTGELASCLGHTNSRSVWQGSQYP